jgi:hypothetical protein
VNDSSVSFDLIDTVRRGLDYRGGWQREFLMLAVRGALIAGVVFSAAAAYAAAMPLAVKTGLWEVTVKGEVQGQAAIPPAALAHMTPEQRAQIQARMNSAGGAHTFKECVTQAELQKGFSVANRGPHQGSHDCSQTVVSSSGARLEAHIDCKSGNNHSFGTVRFSAADQGSVNGVVDMTVETQGRTMTVKSTISGHWLGADCGTVKPGQIETAN